MNLIVVIRTTFETIVMKPVCRNNLAKVYSKWFLPKTQGFLFHAARRRLAIFVSYLMLSP